MNDSFEQDDIERAEDADVEEQRRPVRRSDDEGESEVEEQRRPVRRSDEDEESEVEEQRRPVR
jgi:hypothetical protein